MWWSRNDPEKGHGIPRTLEQCMLLRRHLLLSPFGVLGLPNLLLILAPPNSRAVALAECSISNRIESVCGESLSLIYNLDEFAIIA